MSNIGGFEPHGNFFLLILDVTSKDLSDKGFLFAVKTTFSV